MNLPGFNIDNKFVISLRGKKNKVDAGKPYAYLVEKERMPSGHIEEISTIFLTNKACPFTCLMCDLWHHTTDYTVAKGAIPAQIEYALTRMPQTKHIKLYNSGNFFDAKAIPPGDHGAIASLLSAFDTVIVENHPKMTDRRIFDFRDKLKSKLQIAMGLETIHPGVLPLLNKQMNVDDFEKAVRLLLSQDILTRAFILLRPPFLSEEEGIVWAQKSIDFAFNCGVECCAVIPTRSGNGAMEVLESEGLFESPQIASLEQVQAYGIGLGKGRVFADLWDLEHFSNCSLCFEKRRMRMEMMNLEQMIYAPIVCSCQVGEPDQNQLKT
ncbi:MAG: radical SAM protein [Cyclobacteriaceae bacterium]|nr:radical SAM protein [Cyclobacteriaceae bacterium]